MAPCDIRTRCLAGSRQFEALTAILQDNTVVDDFLYHDPAFDLLTLFYRAIV